MKTEEKSTVIHYIQQEKKRFFKVRPEEKTVKPEGLAFIQLQYTDSKGIWKPMEKHNIKVTVENGVLKGLGSPAPYVKGNYTDHTVATYYGEAMAVVQADGNGPVKVTVADEERFYVVGNSMDSNEVKELMI